MTGIPFSFTFLSSPTAALSIQNALIPSSSCLGRVWNRITNTKTKMGPFNLPSDLLGLTYSYLNLAELRATCCVSKQWNKASKNWLWKNAIYKELAFGNDKWAEIFGKEVVDKESSKAEFSSLPVNIVEDYRRFQRLFPEKNAKESLILVGLPKTLDGRLTLSNLGKLAMRFPNFPYSSEGYRYPISDELGAKSIEKSCWVLMTTDVLPFTIGEDWEVQQTLVSDLAKRLIGFEISDSLEAAACIIVQYFKSQKHLFPKIFTRCQDQGGRDGPYQVTIGLFNYDIQIFENKINCGLTNVGVAVRRKF